MKGGREGRTGRKGGQEKIRDVSLIVHNLLIGMLSLCICVCEKELTFVSK